MFAPNTRDAGLPEAPGRGPQVPESARLVKLRALPDTSGEAVTVRAHDQLDAISEARYGGDATRYWHVADANSELEAAELTREPGRVIDVPGS